MENYGITKYLSSTDKNIPQYYQDFDKNQHGSYDDFIIIELCLKINCMYF